MLKLTPSRVRDFQTCGWRYRLMHVDQVSPLAPSEGPPLALGASLHTALKTYYRLSPTEARATSPAALLRPAWVHGQYADLEEERGFYTEALAMLTQYMTLVGRREAQRHQMEVTLTQRTMIAGQEVQLRGRIDRLEKHADGSVVVVDYKTSVSGATPGPAWLASDLPTFIYHQLVHRTFQTAPRIVVAQLNLRTLAETQIEYALSQLVSNHTALATLVDSITHHAFDPHPSPACRWCPARLHCDAWHTAQAG